MGYCENRNQGPSVENPELANGFLFKREVGQNTALRASATAGNSTVLFSTFPVHSTSLKKKKIDLVPAFGAAYDLQNWTSELNLSLPRCRLKKTNKSAKFETFKPFCLLFRTGM